MQPPVLDGQLRTGSVAFASHNGIDNVPTDDMGEEPWDEDDVEDNRDGQAFVDSAEYKSANGVLYELHALQRHRLLFAPPSALLQAERIPASYQQAPSKGHPYLQDPPLRTEKVLGRISQDSHLRPVEGHHDRRHDNKCGTVIAELTAEEQLVKERYEDANRALGALFLSRRRAADAAGDT